LNNGTGAGGYPVNTSGIVGSLHFGAGSLLDNGIFYFVSFDTIWSKHETKTTGLGFSFWINYSIFDHHCVICKISLLLR